jgi:hypothetical protein
MHIYNWYHSSITGIHYVHEHNYNESRIIPFFLLFSIPLCSPFVSPLLTWNPPCCDRIRPPRTQVARKLTSPFPLPGSYTPPFQSPDPQGFPDPNIHSLGRHYEPGSQDRAQFWGPVLPVLTCLFCSGGSVSAVQFCLSCSGSSDVTVGCETRKVRLA